ncbi:SCO2400 family protein [Actinacidiphila alni]|uniref:SCO2400 family protein n=1 Tax=Actinacidiphila alni TaxID=380248 RepID=UPI003457199A
MDYCYTCRRTLNGALVCPGCGAYAPDIAPLPADDGFEPPIPEAVAPDEPVEAALAPRLAGGRAARRRQMERWRKNRRRAGVATAVALFGGGVTVASMQHGSSAGRGTTASASHDTVTLTTDKGSPTAGSPASSVPASSGRHAAPSSHHQGVPAPTATHPVTTDAGAAPLGGNSPATQTTSQPAPSASTAPSHHTVSDSAPTTSSPVTTTTTAPPAATTAPATPPPASASPSTPPDQQGLCILVLCLN